MNLSGDSVQPAAAFLKVAPADVIVVHDELDLPWSDVRLKVGGGHAGQQRGAQHHPAPRDARLREGARRHRKAAAGLPGRRQDWVLSAFDAAERAELPDVVARAVDAVERVARDGLAAAMNVVNTRG